MAGERGRSMAAQPHGAPDAFNDSDCSGFNRGSCHTSRGGPATSTANPTTTISPTSTANPTSTAGPTSRAGTEGCAHHAGGTTEAEGPHGPGEPPAHRARRAAPARKHLLS